MFSVKLYKYSRSSFIHTKKPLYTRRRAYFRS
nr:MAG TPA: hypothetical protein [Bacteriophage sp.]